MSAFAPKAIGLLRGSEMTLCADYVAEVGEFDCEALASVF
jgi:hypothetical protein